jgi:hypothetical protein
MALDTVGWRAVVRDDDAVAQAESRRQARAM